MLDWTDIVSRLGAAMAIGGALGLNRELHNKPTGLRTLGLVGLGSALAVLAVADDPQADISRVIQGVITGVGFLGAGVILHRPADNKVHGLTTAATIWVTGAGCAVRHRCLAHNPCGNGAGRPPVDHRRPVREMVPQAARRREDARAGAVGTGPYPGCKHSSVGGDDAGDLAGLEA
jgi:putative Mg2+ transporter-C (MgtC) family protein